MKQKVSDLRGGSRTVDLDVLPKECPLCHAHGTPRILLGSIKVPDFESDVQLVFQCTSEKCQGVYIGYYLPPRGAAYMRLARVAPKIPATPPVPPLVSSLSPRFVEVYAQALAADAFDLDQVAGVGLRKALEVLVKDLAIHTHANDKATIIGMPLSACVERFVRDPNARDCAKRATWLGNDEAHYQRRWVEKDIEDLKTLIALTVNWTESTLITEKYRRDMPS